MQAAKYLTTDEQQRLEASCQAFTRNDCLILLALRTGARSQELLNIKVTDLDEAGVHIRALKGGRDRYMPLKKDFVRKLKAIQGKERLFEICPQRLRQVWSFYSPNKKPFHSLRHTYAVRLYSKTKDVLLAKDALGHKAISSTMVYAASLDTVAKLRRAAV